MITEQETLKLVATLREGVVEKVNSYATYSIILVRGIGSVHNTTTPAESLWKAYYFKGQITPAEGDRVLLGFSDLEMKTNPYVIGILEERDNTLIIGDKTKLPGGSFYYRGKNSAIIANGESSYVGLLSGKSRVELDGKVLSMIVEDIKVGHMARDFLLFSTQPDAKDKNSYFSLRSPEVELSSRGKLFLNSDGLQSFYGSAYIGNYNGGQYKLTTGDANIFHKSHVLTSSSYTHRVVSRKAELAGSGGVSALTAILTPTYTVSVAEGAIDFGTTEGSIKHTVLTPGNPLTVIQSDMGFEGLVGRFEMNGIGEALLRASKDITFRTPSLPAPAPATSQMKMTALGQVTVESILQQTFRLPPAPTPGVPATAILDMLAVGTVEVGGVVKVALQVPPAPLPATAGLELLPSLARLKGTSLVELAVPAVGTKVAGLTIAPGLVQTVAPINIVSKGNTPGLIEPVPQGWKLFSTLTAMTTVFDTHIHVGILGPVSPPLAPMSPSLATLLTALLSSTNFTE